MRYITKSASVSTVALIVIWSMTPEANGCLITT